MIHLAVAIEHRRQGVATGLFDALKPIAKEGVAICHSRVFSSGIYTIKYEIPAKSMQE